MGEWTLVHPAKTASRWYSRNAPLWSTGSQFTIVSSGRTSSARRALAANSVRPAWVRRAALGAPVLPEDSISSATSDPAGSAWSSAGSAPRHSSATATRRCGAAAVRSRAPGPSVSTRGASSVVQACSRRSYAGEPGTARSAIAAGWAPPRRQAQKAGKNSPRGNPHNTTTSPARSPRSRSPPRSRRARARSWGYGRRAGVPSVVSVTTPAPVAAPAARSRASTGLRGSCSPCSGSGPRRSACPWTRSMCVPF